MEVCSVYISKNVRVLFVSYFYKEDVNMTFGVLQIGRIYWSRPVFNFSLEMYFAYTVPKFKFLHMLYWMYVLV